MKACPLFHENFFDSTTSLDIVGGVSLQSGIINQRTYFSPVHSFLEKIDDPDFQIYVNPGDANAQHLFKLSRMGHMPPHEFRSTVWCALSGQSRGRGACGPLGFNNPAARWRLFGLLWCYAWHIMFGDVPMINMTKTCVLCHLNKTSCLSETVEGAKIDEIAF